MPDSMLQTFDLVKSFAVRRGFFALAGRQTKFLFKPILHAFRIFYGAVKIHSRPPLLTCFFLICHFLLL